LFFSLVLLFSFSFVLGLNVIVSFFVSPVSLKKHETVACTGAKAVFFMVVHDLVCPCFIFVYVEKYTNIGLVLAVFAHF
jgi:hypothetical protein